MVSFSHDPCERPLNLITQMPGSRNGNGARASNGVFAASPGGYVNGGNDFAKLLPHSPRRVQRPVVDAEGWQTVGKRK